MSIISVKNVFKSFDSKPVLDGISFDVEEGDSLVILGGSGSGKTVLLRCIMGLLKPDSGQIVLNGKIINELSRQEQYEVNKSIGMCFQMAALFDSMTVEENIEFPLLRHTDMTKAKRQARIEECLNMVGLKNTQKLKPAELSGGMKRRVGFARAIALQPKILLFDEPTTGLDPVMTDVINRIILNLKHQLGVTSITITHDLKSALSIADNIAMVFKGKCIAIQKPNDFRNNQNTVIQQFLRGEANGPFLDDPPPPIYKK